MLVCDSCNKKKKKTNAVDKIVTGSSDGNYMLKMYPHNIFYRNPENKEKLEKWNNQVLGKYTCVRRLKEPKKLDEKEQKIISCYDNQLTRDALWTRNTGGVKVDNTYFFNKMNINSQTKHLTALILNHGDEEQKFQNNKDNLLSEYFERIKDKDFKRLSSCYIKSAACHGAYYDGTTSIFDEIQEKLRLCKDNAPKCFVRLVKKDHILVYQDVIDDNGQRVGVKYLPLTKFSEEAFKSKEMVDYEKLSEEKDKYFDYYYVTKDAIYKVPHELVHNRVKLIDEGKFEKEFQKTQNIDINSDVQEENKVKARKIQPEVDFKEFYDSKKERQGMINAYNASNGLRINTPQNNFSFF